jgi:2'-5' RNA ligase
MRLFSGIAFDDATRAAFARALDLARPHADHAKWEKVEKAHLTLEFLGEADPAVHGARLVEVAARHAPFTLRLSGAGAFDRRILWLGVDGDLGALRSVRLELGPLDQPVYTPHITLARAKKPRSFAPAVKALEGFAAPPFRVEALTLFESRHGSYVPLTTAALRR